jgi:hypothetical protein
MRTFVWLGARRTLVGQFVPWLIDDIVRRVTGLPPTRQVNAAVRGLAFPITIPDATPVPRELWAAYGWQLDGSS